MHQLLICRLLSEPVLRVAKIILMNSSLLKFQIWSPIFSGCKSQDILFTSLKFIGAFSVVKVISVLCVPTCFNFSGNCISLVSKIFWNWGKYMYIELFTKVCRLPLLNWYRKVAEMLRTLGIACFSLAVRETLPPTKRGFSFHFQ